MFENGVVCFYVILHIDEIGGPIGLDMHISKGSIEGREKGSSAFGVYSVGKVI